MPDFNIESLKNGINSCKKSIIIFEEAIEKERATISEYYEMIETVQRKEREATAIENGISINIEQDDNTD